MTDEPRVHTVSTFDDARVAYRLKDLRQALYDDGEVVMADVLVNLHGDEHRARRRLENRLFRRDTFHAYERGMFPSVIEDTVKPHVAEGRAELVSLGHQLMMNLAALTAGVDRPLGTPEETFHLYRYLMRFIEGATLAHYTGDKDAKRAEVAEALDQFDAEFLQPSIATRRALLDQVAAGEVGEEELPRDVLTVLLRNQDQLHLPPDVVRREVAFFLLAGAHTSATAFTRAMHQTFTWIAANPEDEAKVENDRLFVQRCVHETVRLEPSSPVAMRRALAPVTLADGTPVAVGDRVVIDLMQVNRDPAVFGDDAGEFNPHRPLPDGVMPYGLSFGAGMHACIGQDLAAGVVPVEGEDFDQHLFGLVTVAVQTLFDHGARPDPNDPPERDASTKRPYWGRYPVVFRR